MFNNKLILPLLTSCLLPFTLHSKVKDKKKPNVIIILADDIGYGDLGWLGSKTINTPNVNKLAAEGIRFTNCHATSSISTPSRYGLLTGMYPWRKKGTGIAAGDAAMIINPGQYTMPDMFQSLGYTTGAIGKWHLGLGNETGKQNWNDEIRPNLSDIGFNYSYIMAATADRVPCVFIENGKAVNLDPNDPIQVSYKKPFPDEPTGRSNPEMLRMHPSHGHDMAIINGIPRIGYMKGGKSALWRDEDIADSITQKAVNFIRNNQDNPFFLYLGTNDIHVPRIPHERFVGKSGMGPRGDAILSFDECVGKVMSTLDSLHLSENTIIILTSDNGPVIDDGYNDQAEELLGVHKPSGGFRGGKYSVFEAGTRVPMIIRWKKAITKPMISDALVSQIDLFRSFSKYFNHNITSYLAPDSKNLWKTLIGKNVSGRKYLIEQNVNNTLALVTQHYKYIEASSAPLYNFDTNVELGNQKKEQLYDLKIDKNEKKNLSDSKIKLAKKLKNKLEREKMKFNVMIK